MTKNYRVDRDMLIEAYSQASPGPSVLVNVMRAERFPLRIFSELREPASPLIFGIIEAACKVAVGVQKVLAK